MEYWLVTRFDQLFQSLFCVKPESTFCPPGSWSATVVQWSRLPNPSYVGEHSVLLTILSFILLSGKRYSEVTFKIATHLHLFENSKHFLNAVNSVCEWTTSYLYTDALGFFLCQINWTKLLPILRAVRHTVSFRCRMNASQLQSSHHISDFRR